jgi:hypothetical protein
MPTASAAIRRGNTGRSSARDRITASTPSASMSTRPTLRVLASSAPASAASPHRSRLANQNAETAASRNSPSEYGARKKKAVGKSAMSSTVSLAVSRDMPSSRVSPCSITSAPAKQAFDTSSAAPSGPTPGSQATARIISG